MADQNEAKLGWAERRERHTPAETATDRMVRLGGVERESRFKDD